MSDKELTDRVAIVTGGANGIGKAIAKAMAEQGAKVLIADYSEEDARKAVEELNTSGHQASYIKVDVSDSEQINKMVEFCNDTFGQIDILINNAGLFTNLEKKPFFETTVEEWDRIMAVNLRSVFLCATAAFPYLKNSKNGKIINMASATAFKGAPPLAAYAVSKAGIVNLTKTMAKELGRYGICVNAIAPGHTKTALAKSSNESFELHAKERCIPRVQMPEDITGVALFLASPASNFMTGQTLVVDGGVVMN